MRMTTKSSTQASLRAIRQFVLGPWPIHAVAMWTLLSTVYLSVLWRLFGRQGMFPGVAQVSHGLLIAVAFGLLLPGFVLVPLMLYGRIRHRFVRHAMRSPEYLLTLLVASAIAGIILNFLIHFSPFAMEVLNHPGFIESTLRIFFPLWFISAVLGSVFARIQKESDSANAALQTVVAQRRLLLESEERVRGQVATYLHDRVQTDLVSIGLRIRAAVASGSEVLVADVDDALADLERVRAEEIRGASRQLSPNLEHVTLDAALRDLAKAYRPGMVITIHVSDAAARELARQDQTNRSIGLYRICEQGLLNAAAHGHATECSVHISLTARGEILLELQDNGVGLPTGAITPGMGSTVISAWVEALSGEWSLTPAHVGVTLMASFPGA